MRHKITISLFIVLGVILITLASYATGAFVKPEYVVYDSFAKSLRSDTPTTDKVKIILIDEASLKSMSEIAGRWPWPRAIWSDLLDFLAMGGARAVLFDVLFLERQDKVNDNALITATRNSQNVYHSIMIYREEADSKISRTLAELNPLPASLVDHFALKNVTTQRLDNPDKSNNDFALPINGLPEVSKGLAVVEFTPDSDSVYRRSKPLREYQGNYFPVLGLAPFVSQDTPVEIEQGMLN